MDLLELIKRLNVKFKLIGCNIYAVGGTVRDFILKKDLTDFDFATDASPSETKSILEKYDDTFSKYGVIIYRYENKKLEITSFRKENLYFDSRHPQKIEFVKDMQIDYKRRDFTINALYMDETGKIYDFCNGLNDLHNKIIRVIGDIDTRMNEDPLRILRALRFMMTLDFTLDNNLEKYIYEHTYLLNKLNVDKIKQEIRKMQKIDEEKTKVILEKFHINMFNN